MENVESEFLIDLTEEENEDGKKDVETVDLSSDCEEETEDEASDSSSDEEYEDDEVYLSSDSEDEVVCEDELAVRELIRLMESQDKKRKRVEDEEQLRSSKNLKTA